MSASYCGVTDAPTPNHTHPHISREPSASSFSLTHCCRRRHSGVCFQQGGSRRYDRRLHGRSWRGCRERVHRGGVRGSLYRQRHRPGGPQRSLDQEFVKKEEEKDFVIDNVTFMYYSYERAGPPARATRRIVQPKPNVSKPVHPALPTQACGLYNATATCTTH